MVEQTKSAMNAIKLMPDYGCFPLWDVSPDRVGNINPDTLPISPLLKERLATWAERYDATLNLNDPLESGFARPEDQYEFEKDGRMLVEALRMELGSEFSITVQI